VTSISTHPTGSTQVPTQGIRAGSAVNLILVLLLVGVVVRMYRPAAKPYLARSLV